MIYLPGVPVEEAERLAAAMKIPEGTVVFWATHPGLFDASTGTIRLMRVVIGQLMYTLDRDADLIVRFLHSSPGTGTRQAEINLHSLRPEQPCDRFFFSLVWSPEETRLHIGRGDGGGLREGTGRAAPFMFQVGADGTVVRLGDAGVQVAGARMYAGGKTVLAPTAIKLWEDTLLAARTLLSGKSEVGYIFEVVTANAVIAALVTGFECYSAQRFMELEAEGVQPDFGALVRSFLSREERDQFEAGTQLSLEQRAAETGVSAVGLLADRINFQNYDDAKRAFNRGYGLKFGELPAITSQDLQHLQRLIRYRHRVIHVSPLLGMLNGPECPPEVPFFANTATATAAISSVDSFISTLHKATLKLRSRPPSTPTPSGSD